MILQIVPLYPDYSSPGEHPLPPGPEGYTLYHIQIIEDPDVGPILYALWWKP